VRVALSAARCEHQAQARHNARDPGNPEMQSSNPPTQDVPDLSDLRCSGCGYLLRGLSPHGRCPECGLPILTSIEAAMARVERKRRQDDLLNWDIWKATLRRPPLLDPPLSDAGRPWLLIQGIAVSLLAIAHAGVGFWAVQYASWVGGSLDPDAMLFGVSGIYLVGVWLLSWPQPADPRRGWRTRLEHWAMRILAMTAPVSIGMMWYDWWYVPWYDFGRYEQAAGWIVLLVGICQWLVFDHLSHLAARTRAGPTPDYFRAARYASICAWLLVCLLWVPDATRHGGPSLPGAMCCCPPASLVVYLYPPALLVASVVMFVRDAKAAGRGKPPVTVEPE
jgi:hypothetical protein